MYNVSMTASETEFTPMFDGDTHNLERFVMGGSWRIPDKVRIEDGLLVFIFLRGRRKKRSLKSAAERGALREEQLKADNKLLLNFLQLAHADKQEILNYARHIV